MKAYEVTTSCREKGSDIVFAENAGKAKAIAQYCECCEDEPYTEIRVKRIKDLDGMENLLPNEGAWASDEFRLILVRGHNWTCTEPEYADCDKCVAKKYCHWHDE